MNSATNTKLPRGMSLEKLCDKYGQVRDVKKSTVDQVRYAVRTFNKWTGKAVMVRELRDELLNDWINFRLERGDNRITIRQQRAAILCLWRLAIEIGIARRPPLNIKKVRRPITVPEAWTIQDVVALVMATRTLRGEFNFPGARTRGPDGRPRGIKRGPFFKALFLVAWYTGLRPCDLRALRFDQITKDGKLVIVQEKTGWPLVAQLPEEAMEALKLIRHPPRELVFPIGKKTLCYYVNKFTEVAGVRKGSMKWFRRSSATALEAVSPGAAMAHLGHKTPGLAVKHYIDPRQVQISKPQVPSLPIFSTAPQAGERGAV